MNEDVNKSDDMKNKKIIISLLLGSSPLFLMLFTLFVAVFLVLGLFDVETKAGNVGYYGGGSISESGSFTISGTLLEQDEFKNQLSAAVSKYPSLQIFADNADEIYYTAQANGVNPELVITRAIKEGFSPGVKYNYWGIGCTNTGEGRDCATYSDFKEGLNAFIEIVNDYSTLIDLMKRYSYIGDYWYNPGGSGVGGCYYAPYIYESVPDRVQEACSSSIVCSKDNTSNCVATTAEDQNAYAIWQVNGMLEIRNSIFDVKVKSNQLDSGSLSSTSEIIAMFDADAWKTLTGYSSSAEANSNLTRTEMDSRMVSITVPIRVWASNEADDYTTKKSEISLTVNKNLAYLYIDFFNDIYNETGTGDNLFVINPSEVGCYNYRLKTSGKSLSAHAFGAACDINWTTYGNGYDEVVYTKDKWNDLEKSKSKYQIIYKDSKVAQIAHKYTLSWGGDWNSVTDAMHFSFIGDESRSTLKSRS